MKRARNRRPARSRRDPVAEMVLRLRGTGGGGAAPIACARCGELLCACPDAAWRGGA